MELFDVFNPINEINVDAYQLLLESLRWLNNNQNVNLLIIYIYCYALVLNHQKAGFCHSEPTPPNHNAKRRRTLRLPFFFSYQF